MFSLLHANNYVGNTLPFILLSPLIVLTQFVSGIMMAYIRIRINFFTGVFFHSLWNFLVVIAIPSMQFCLSDPYIKQSKEYRISIEEKLFFDQDERLIKIDSNDGKFYSVKSFQYTIDDLVDTLGLKVPYRYGDVIDNLKFHSRDGISKTRFWICSRKNMTAIDHDFRNNNIKRCIFTVFRKEPEYLHPTFGPFCMWPAK